MIRGCPSPDVLLALDEGVLPEQMSAEVAQHLEQCPVCEQLRRDLEEPCFTDPTAAELAHLRNRVFGVGKRRAAIAGLVAAGVVIGVVGWWAMERDTPPVAPRVAHYRLVLEPAPLRLPFSAVRMRGSEPVSDAYLAELGRALEPYRAGRYREAVQTLAALAAKYPQAVEAPFYEGVARLMVSDVADALAALERARAIGGEALDDDIAWYLAVASERSGDWARASGLLGRLCAQEGIHQNAACQGVGRR